MSKSRLIIVDVSNFIFRAFYAVRPMHSATGVPTNAVYGVLTMMLKLLADHQPTHVLLARDTKGGSFRNELFENYKANRTEPPEDLIPQFALIDELLNKMNLPSSSDTRFEADDIIGSAATQWKNHFDEILIASGDKDLMQFVGGNIRMLDTMKDKIYSPADVEEKMGVRPDQIVDYLAIVGDTSDNIPGMKGIGAVGAAKLLKEYGTFENIVANKANLKGKKVIEAFENHLEDGIISKKIAQIVTDVDLQRQVEETKVNFYPTHELSNFLKDLGFKSILVKLEEMRFQHHMGKESDERLVVQEDLNVTSVLFEQKVEVNYKLTEVTNENLADVLKALEEAEMVAVNPIFSETEDIYQRELTRLYFTLSELEVFTAGKEFVTSILEKTWGNPKVEVIGDNLKRDYVYSLIHDIPFNSQLFDITLAHFNINTNIRHDIDVLMEEYLNLKVSEDENFNNALRAYVLLRLKNIFTEEMKKLKVLEIYETIDLKIIPVLARMEKEGIYLNTNYLKELEVELNAEIKKVEAEILQASGEEINLNSPKQVGALLFEKLGLPIVKKTKTGYSTDAEVLEELDGMNLSPIPGMLLVYREYGKILSTYVRALPELVNPQTKRVHTNYNLTVAQTGRLSSTNPNLQNIPVRSKMGEKVRKAFIAKPGRILLSADYSQVELRLLAHFSQDESMLKAFKENLDIHAQTASEVLDIHIKDITKNERSMAKTVNFGLMYGQSSFGLAATLKISRSEAKNYIEKYFERFRSIKTFLDTLKEKAEMTGYAETLYGRKRSLPDIHSKVRTIKAQAERMAINSPIQGTAADIIKLAMIKIDEEMRQKNLKSKMLLQVHDELIFEVIEEELEIMKELVRSGMETVANLSVPLNVEMGIGVNWLDLK